MRKYSNKKGGADRTKCVISYERFDNTKCFEEELARQIDLAIGKFVNENNFDGSIDDQSRLLFDSIKSRMFPYLIQIMKMRDNNTLLDLKDWNRAYNFLISLIVLCHIDKVEGEAEYEGKIINFEDLKADESLSKEHLRDCLKKTECLSLNPKSRTQILYSYLIRGDDDEGNTKALVNKLRGEKATMKGGAGANKTYMDMSGSSNPSSSTSVEQVYNNPNTIKFYNSTINTGVVKSQVDLPTPIPEKN